MTTTRRTDNLSAWARELGYPMTFGTPSVVKLAAGCAYAAVQQGAQAPWTGDMQAADIRYAEDGLGRPMTADEARVFARVFRTAVSEMAADRELAARRAEANAWDALQDRE